MKLVKLSLGFKEIPLETCTIVHTKHYKNDFSVGAEAYFSSFVQKTFNFQADP